MCFSKSEFQYSCACQISSSLYVFMHSFACVRKESHACTRIDTLTMSACMNLAPGAERAKCTSANISDAAGAGSCRLSAAAVTAPAGAASPLSAGALDSQLRILKRIRNREANPPVTVLMLLAIVLLLVGLLLSVVPRFCICTRGSCCEYKVCCCSSQEVVPVQRLKSRVNLCIALFH